jgi:hypothetical protein
MGEKLDLGPYLSDNGVAKLHALGERRDSESRHHCVRKGSLTARRPLSYEGLATVPPDRFRFQGGNLGDIGGHR